MNFACDSWCGTSRHCGPGVALRLCQPRCFLLGLILELRNQRWPELHGPEAGQSHRYTLYTSHESHEECVLPALEDGSSALRGAKTWARCKHDATQTSNSKQQSKLSPPVVLPAGGNNMDEELLQYSMSRKRGRDDSPVHDSQHLRDWLELDLPRIEERARLTECDAESAATSRIHELHDYQARARFRFKKCTVRCALRRPGASPHASGRLTRQALL